MDVKLEITLDTLLPLNLHDADDDYIAKMLPRAEESRQLARLQTMKAQERRRYDSKHQMTAMFREIF